LPPLLEVRVTRDGRAELLRCHRDALAHGLLKHQLLLHKLVDGLPADADHGALLSVLLAEKGLVHSIELPCRRLERLDRNVHAVDAGSPGSVLTTARRATAPRREGPPDEHED